MIRPQTLARTLLAIALAHAAADARAHPADAPATAPKSDAIDAALARPILPVGKTLDELQIVLDDWVRPFPAAKLASRELWQEHVQSTRALVLDQVVFRNADDWRNAKTKVEWVGELDGGPGYRIKKVRFEVIPGLWIPALLYDPDKLADKVPAVLNVNGHDANGMAADYKQMRCLNLAKRGVRALSLEWFGMGQLRGFGDGHDQINRVNLCGKAGISLFYLAMSRGLDLLLGLEHADPLRLGVTGLSGGGWQTIFISALDPRVTLSVPVAGYSSFRTRVWNAEDLGDSEQTPNGLGAFTDYDEMTAWRAPQPTLLIFNASDNCCFKAGNALPPLMTAARPVFHLYDDDVNLQVHVNKVPGTHNYGLDNRQALYRFLGAVFFPDDPRYPKDEIPSDKELKTAEQLKVALPKDNLTINDVALGLAKSLPRGSLAEASIALASTVVSDSFEHVLVDNIAWSQTNDGVVAVAHAYLDRALTLPVLELAKAGADAPRSTVLVLSDAGRKGAAALVKPALAAGSRVLTLDPVFLGETTLPHREQGLFPLLVETFARTPLGMQADQVIAVARRAKASNTKAPLKLVAHGPRSCVVALVAAALAKHAVDEVELHEPLGSLKQVISDPKAYGQWPELFCFGFLERYDIDVLVKLCAPRPVKIIVAEDAAAPK